MVTTTAAGSRAGAALTESETPGDAVRGWYLYGVTRRGALAAVLTDADAGNEAGADATDAADDAAPLQLVGVGGLAAVVRPVRLADFSPALLRPRLRDAAALEAMVRSHNRVIEAVHRRQAILPAKFGLAYADARDVVSALRPVHDTLLRQLDRLEGCDEWAVHLYADPAIVRERVAAGDPAVRRLREEWAAARPGRAYFLERQLDETLETATEQALLTIGQSVFDRLERCAVAGEVTPVEPAADTAEEAEILRAAFLVARDAAAHFQAEMSGAPEAAAGVRCEYSGPWPPYSFAAWDDEEAE